jgi:hypothetical protein
MRALRLLAEKAEAIVVTVGVGLVLVVVLGGNLVGLSLGEKATTAAILAALFVILRLAVRLYDVQEATGAILDHVRHGTQVRRFKTYPEFYKCLNSAMADAKAFVRLTHIRDHPPAAFRMESSYFTDVERWASARPECPVRRVIAVNNDAMFAWAEALHETEGKLPNFCVRACAWGSAFPMINMAILDEQDVFLAISGDSPEQTAGVWISDPEVCRYFIDYFDNLWREALPIGKVLASGPPSSRGASARV